MSSAVARPIRTPPASVRWATDGAAVFITAGPARRPAAATASSAVAHSVLSTVLIP